MSETDDRSVCWQEVTTRDGTKVYGNASVGFWVTVDDTQVEHFTKPGLTALSALDLYRTTETDAVKERDGRTQ